MEVIRFNLSGQWNDIEQNIIEIAVGVIKRGGSFVYPTDTVYGLGVDALRIDSIERLFKIKKRPATKPVPIMIRDIEMAKQIAFVNKKQEAVLKKVWPGPVTVVLEKRRIIPEVLTAKQRTIGLRIPDCQFTQALMENLVEPITVTSANLSGQPPLISSREVIKNFEKAYPRPDLILDAGDLPASPPSTVLDLTSSQPKILRVGPVSGKDLMKILS
ncbi:MAG: threonylcarbamoyl-AMP synthase [Parcubacteria group bacterium]|jgi:L-threonylcarbamoyladenylate synthase|nr:threonylcarbamoyl-AMP synthase [Parcubacteria group bacterium]|tara:strand:+ start:72 stop:719 length:648 start_codon:yes stop_codon:yes gene_type:complete